MATGTGKTLTAAAVIKLFLRSGNARRVLFLVDRLELEDQAKKAFAASAVRRLSDGHLQGEPGRLAPGGDRRHHRAVAALQQQVPEALLADRLRPRHLRRSAPLHRRQCPRRLRLLHRLQARPDRHAARLPQADSTSSNPGTRDPREAERRLLLDTYRTFGCENSQPTFRYSLLDGVKDGYLINPTVVDARTEITTELLSEEGFVVSFTDDTGEDQEQAFKQREFEKRFFAGRHQPALLQDLPRKRAARSGQRRDRQVDHLRRQPEPRRQAGADPQPDGRPHVPRQVPVRLRRAGHLADSRRPAVHHQLHQQQPARLGQLPARLQDQQGPRLRHRRHDDHRLRLHRTSSTSASSARSSRPPTSSRSRGAARASTTSCEQIFDDSLKDGVSAAAEDGLQALRLLRQLRVLRGGVQLRRSAEAPPAPRQGRRRRAAARAR